MNKIRVGLIRCDTHGMYYGALMDRHDPHKLMDPLAGKGGGRYTWQSGGVHFYFYTFYADRYRMTVPQAEGFEITKVWDEDYEAAQMFADVFYNKPTVCKKFEEVSDDVDMVFIADCNGDGSDHLRLALPGIEKRVPTFIDKPFTYNTADAVKIVETARNNDTPVMSFSMLRTIPKAAQFAARLSELGTVEFGTIKGFGGSLAGQIHSISLAQHIFGAGVEAVECMGRTELAHVLLEYGDRPQGPKAGVMLNCDSGGAWHSSMYASAYSSQGVIHSTAINDFDFPSGALWILEKCRVMVHSRQPQASYDEMIECVAIGQAARIAQQNRCRITVRDIM